MLVKGAQDRNVFEAFAILPCDGKTILNAMDGIGRYKDITKYALYWQIYMRRIWDEKLNQYCDASDIY